MMSLNCIYIININLFYSNLQQTYGQWQIVFAILAVIYLVGSTAYLFMGSGELQSWNTPPERKSDQDTEQGVPLNQKTPQISS